MLKINILKMSCYSTAGGIRQSASRQKNEFYQYCPKILNGWDYSLSTKKAAEFKHDQFVREIKV